MIYGHPLILGGLAVLLLIGLILIGMPVAPGMLLVGMLGLSIIVGPTAMIGTLGQVAMGTLNSYVLTVIPAFIFMGYLASESGIVTNTFGALNKWVGHWRCGLPVATIGAGAFFGAACGSSMASASTLGAVCVPQMRKYGYTATFSASCVAASALLALTIPPSTMLVIYGIVAQESIGQLLIAGIVPGVFTAAMYGVGVWLRQRFVGLGGGSMASKSSWIERLSSLKEIIPVGILFISVMGGIYAGIVTPTEAGSLGAAIAFIFLVIRRKGEWRQATMTALKQTAMITVTIEFIVFASFYFSYFLARIGFVGAMGDFFKGLNVPAIVILVLILLADVPLGMFLEGLSNLLLFMPIFFPVVVALGYDPVWFGIVMVMMVEIGMLTPPVGIIVYVMKAIVPEVSLGALFKDVTFFVVLTLICIAALIAVPELALWLPRMMKGS